MEHNEQLPGVTFRLDRADKLPPINPKKHKAIGRVELHADINDFEVWDEVLSKLSGLRIYTIENLAEEMVNVTQKKAKETEQALSARNQELKAALERVKQELSFATLELRQLMQTLALQEKELRRLRTLERELEQLEEEAEGLAFERDLG